MFREKVKNLTIIWQIQRKSTFKKNFGLNFMFVHTCKKTASFIYCKYTIYQQEVKNKYLQGEKRGEIYGDKNEFYK